VFRDISYGAVSSIDVSWNGNKAPLDSLTTYKQVTHSKNFRVFISLNLNKNNVILNSYMSLRKNLGGGGGGG
jgi:hypothetical protein